MDRSKTGLNRDDTEVEPGSRQGLHRGNTVTVINFVGTVPRFITVYRLVCTGANRGRTGTVRTRLKGEEGFYYLLSENKDQTLKRSNSKTKLTILGRSSYDVMV